MMILYVQKVKLFKKQVNSKPRMAGMLAAFTLNSAGGYLAGRELKKQADQKYEQNELFRTLRDSIEEES